MFSTGSFLKPLNYATIGIGGGLDLLDMDVE